MFRNAKKKQIENIQINHAIVFINYGETDQEELGLTRGAAEFVVTEEVRQIEHDGMRGKEKGLMVVDSVNASLKVPMLQVSSDIAKMALAAATHTAATEEAPAKIEGTPGGVIPDDHYLKNVTAFARKMNGKCCKITLLNPSSESGLTIATQDKGEAVIELLLEAHWDPTAYETGLYTLEDDVDLPAQT